MRRALVIVVALALALTACGGGDDDSADSTFFEVEMTDFDYIPADLTVPADTNITVSLTNTGSIIHEWVILNQGTTITDEDELPEDIFNWDQTFWGQSLDPAGGSSFNLTTPSEPGVYQIVCAIPGHISAGMVGELTVEG